LDDPVTSTADPAHEAADRPLLPSHLDVTASHGSRIIGGPWGRHAGVSRWSWWTPLRVLLAMTCVTLALGFVQKSPCANGDWTSDKQYTHVCYSDVIPLWSDERLDVGAVPYRDTSVEYPVLTGGFMWLTAGMTRGVHALASSWSDVMLFGILTAVLLSLCGLVVTAGTVGAAGRQPYHAALFALSPLLVFHAFTNWDLLAMALTSAAVWAWARRKPVAAGVLIGLGTAAKLYPVFVLIPLFILAIRTRKWAPVWWATAAAAASWLAVNLPIALAYRTGWWEFYKFSEDRPTERSTAWAMLRTLTNSNVSANDAPYWVPPGLAVACALVAALAVIVWIGLAAPYKPRVGQLVFLVVLAFLLTTKVWSPQYSLWLVPLLALARPRWRWALVWQFTEIAVWVLTLMLLHGLDQAGSAGGDTRGVSYGTLMSVLVLRDLMLLAIAFLIVREMWRPDLDVVRADGIDDPAGGFFDGAEDYPIRDSNRTFRLEPALPGLSGPAEPSERSSYPLPPPPFHPPEPPAG
jgi:uncharacterized membrane protein